MSSLVIAMRRGRVPGSGNVYSRIARVFGSTRATLLVPNWPTNRLPLESSAIPQGRDFGVGGVRSLISPLFGSRRPSTLAIGPVYEGEPSRAASGSCGLDPGVAACHALIDSFTGPGTSTAAGLPVTGKVLAR